jgi:hypothetical protein
MATAAQAIDTIVAATGEPEARVFYAARHLRHADADLWPRGRQGGGKGAARVSVHHVVNLLLAVMAANPLTQVVPSGPSRPARSPPTITFRKTLPISC